MANNFFTVAAISKVRVRLMEKTTSFSASRLAPTIWKRDRQVRWRGQGAPPDAIPRPGQQPRSVGLLGRRDRGHRHRDPRPDLVEQGQHRRHRPDALVRPLFAANPAHGRRAAEKVEASIAALYPAFYWFDGTPAPFRHPIRRLPMRGAIFTDGGNTISGRLGFPQPGMFGQAAALIQGTPWTAITRRPSKWPGWPLRRFRQL